MERKNMLRNYLTELKNILTELNPYKAVLFGSYADGENLCAAESLLQNGLATGAASFHAQQ
ncbi:MAG: hypothetical protein D3904_14760, partial [Candidatus Electrothrix sp. EH2]|nr:hypothetical protein [Candidatus Electrothrix sp. EH2]